MHPELLAFFPIIGWGEIEVMRHSADQHQSFMILLSKEQGILSGEKPKPAAFVVGVS
jgi:hypothetical protein